MPVAGTDRGPGIAYNEAIADIAASDGRGAALSLPYEDFSDPDLLKKVLATALKELKLAAGKIDLILDAGSLEAMPLDQATEEHLLATVLEALEVIQPQGFRSII